MKYSIIAIGDELLIGQVTDTNSGWIAREMSVYGWELQKVQVVPDNADAIKKAIDIAFEESDVVLATGGLGPTKDDITKTTLCDYFGGELIFDDATLANVLEVVESVISNSMNTPEIKPMCQAVAKWCKTKWVQHLSCGLKRTKRCWCRCLVFRLKCST